MKIKRSLSFAVLEKKSTISAAELKATLRDYAESGAAILANVVTKLIDRVELNEVDVAELTSSAMKGIEVQTENRMSSTERTVNKERHEYRRVLGHLLDLGPRRLAS